MTALKLNLIVVCVVIGLTAAFACGLLIPGMRSLKQARSELVEKQVAVEADQRNVGRTSALYAEIEQLDELMQDFRRRLPAERQFGEFLNDISESLKESGIDDYIVQPKPAKRLDKQKLPDSLGLVAGTVILPVSVSFESRSTALFDFLGRMESLPRLSNVETMELVNDESQPGRVKVELVLHTYYRPE